MISAAFVAGAVAAHTNGTEPSYTTKLVTAFTTYCPAPTQITYGGSVITVTSVGTLLYQREDCLLIGIRQATTVVLPCPSSCTVTYPVISVPVVYCSTWFAHCNCSLDDLSLT